MFFSAASNIQHFFKYLTEAVNFLIYCKLSVKYHLLLFEYIFCNISYLFSLYIHWIGSIIVTYAIERKFSGLAMIYLELINFYAFLTFYLTLDFFPSPKLYYLYKLKRFLLALVGIYNIFSVCFGFGWRNRVSHLLAAVSFKLYALEFLN